MKDTTLKAYTRRYLKNVSCEVKDSVIMQLIINPEDREVIIEAITEFARHYKKF